MNKKRLLTLMGASVTPFVDPTSISGLLLWCDASQLTGLNDGDAVASFTDLSGNGNHPVQATAAKKPLYKTNIINSLPALLFDGVQDDTGDVMRVGFVRAVPETIIIVFQILTTRETSDIIDGLDAPSTPGLYYGTAETNSIRFNGGASLDYQNAACDSFHIWILEFNGATSKIYKAGSLVKSGNAGTTIGAGITLGANPYYGKFGLSGSNANSNAHMYLAEVIMYNSIITAKQRANIGAYLAAKYGLNFT